MKKTRNQAIVETLLFNIEEPVTQQHLEKCFDEPVDLDTLCDELNDFYKTTNTPLKIQYIAEGYQVMVKDTYIDYLVKIEKSNAQNKLTDSALEVLSIIAYKQPCTKSEIDAIRGVNSYMKTLLEKDLIEIKGRVSGPGRPLLYGTTGKFLEYFGLQNLDALPRMKELEELLSSETGKDEETEN